MENLGAMLVLVINFGTGVMPLDYLIVLHMDYEKPPPPNSRNWDARHMK